MNQDSGHPMIQMVRHICLRTTRAAAVSALVVALSTSLVSCGGHEANPTAGQGESDRSEFGAKTYITSGGGPGEGGHLYNCDYLSTDPILDLLGDRFEIDDVKTTYPGDGMQCEIAVTSVSDTDWLFHILYLQIDTQLSKTDALDYLKNEHGVTGVELDGPWDGGYSETDPGHLAAYAQVGAVIGPTVVHVQWDLNSREEGLGGPDSYYKITSEQLADVLTDLVRQTAATVRTCSAANGSCALHPPRQPALESDPYCKELDRLSVMASRTGEWSDVAAAVARAPDAIRQAWVAAERWATRDGSTMVTTEEVDDYRGAVEEIREHAAAYCGIGFSL